MNELRNLSGKKQEVYLRKSKGCREAFEKVIGEMQTKGYFHLLDSKIVTFGMTGSLNWVERWFKSNGKLTMEEISEICFKRIGNEEGRLISACDSMKGLCRGG